jgi:hypothetical protein
MAAQVARKVQLGPTVESLNISLSHHIQFSSLVQMMNHFGFLCKPLLAGRRDAPYVNDIIIKFLQSSRPSDGGRNQSRFGMRGIRASEAVVNANLLPNWLILVIAVQSSAREWRGYGGN